jgi:ferritin-like metal-binding protein YciE
MKKEPALKNAGAQSNGSGQNGADNNTVEEQKPSLLEKLFHDMLKDMYWAEKHLLQALPVMQKAATTPVLQDAFEDHELATQKHVVRLERVFRLFGKKAEEKKCEAMEGLTDEAKSMISETKDGTMTRDAALIIAAQKVEHYEIASYGSLVQLARTMDREDVALILEETLWEEDDTDALLTRIAERNVNPLADEEGEGQESDTLEYEEVEEMTG